MRLLLTALLCLLAWPVLSAPPPDPMLATPYRGDVAVPDFLVSEKLDFADARAIPAAFSDHLALAMSIDVPLAALR